MTSNQCHCRACVGDHSGYGPCTLPLKQKIPELPSELRRAAKISTSGYWAGVLLEAADEIEAARRQDETFDARDAARYRWLRTRINWSDVEMGMATSRTSPIVTYKARNWTHQDVRPATERPASEHIDEYIDLARAPEKAREPLPNDAYRWVCPTCRTVNDIADANCEIRTCNTPRPADLMCLHLMDPRECSICSALNGSDAHGD